MSSQTTRQRKVDGSSNNAEGVAEKKGALITEVGNAKKRETGKQSSLSGLLLLIICVVLSIALATEYSKSGKDKTSTLQITRGIAKKDSRLLLNGELPPKYESDVVDIEPQLYLNPQTCNYEPKVLTEMVSVKKPMKAIGTNALREKNQVFLMLNSENEGLYVQWNGEPECIYAVSKAAAIALGADKYWMQNGLRLYSQYGIPITTFKDLESGNRIAHILLDDQLWIWPGIEIGHKYNVDGVILTTIGLRPHVFSVENFLSQEEAEKIKEYGIPLLDRSKIDDNGDSGVSKDRTSHTAFLDESVFTRNFQFRSTKLARLPSPTYAERLQLVRYKAGEFYRRHLDTFDSREVIPPKYYSPSIADYYEWANWASSKIDYLGDLVPLEFRKGHALYPVATDTLTFPNALLKMFYEESLQNNFFTSSYSESWAEWFNTTLTANQSHLMESVLKEDGKPDYLHLIIKSWEKKINMHQLRYTVPIKKAINGVTHFYRWIRWVKERVHILGDACPEVAKPYGVYYPKFDQSFQHTMIDILLEDFSADYISHQIGREWYDWIVVNRGKRDVLQIALKSHSVLAEVLIRGWEARVHASTHQELKYEMPQFVKHIIPQRYVTLFLYLNDVEEGGETVFPFSNDRFVINIDRTGMDECSEGLAVPAVGLGASLFYVQTAEQEPDLRSRHGGCPPMKGIKWGSNSFMWNSDSDEGASSWTG